MDALKGEETVEERLLAPKQLALADRVALTKADMIETDQVNRRNALAALVSRINPSARVFNVQDSAAQPQALLEDGIYAPDCRSMDVMA